MLESIIDRLKKLEEESMLMDPIVHYREFFVVENIEQQMEQQQY
jgi:hypothetical protein